MCGITGLYNPFGKVNTRKYYEAHLTIAHRGPDDEGFVSYDGEKIEFYKGDDTIPEFAQYDSIQNVELSQMLFGHRRLSIIDLSKNGHQPYRYENLLMVFNGEIYNFEEIRTELISFGYTFVSSSDTEVVIKAYHKWGDLCFSKFNGMWALAMFDVHQKTLLLSRDRFGQKPLFYAKNNNGTIFFSSEIKFLLAMDKTFDVLQESVVKKYIETSLVDYNERSFYQEILQLKPGHNLKLNSEGSMIESRHWNYKPSFNKSLSSNPLEKFKYLFEDSIRLRMRSDVPVGSLLSGGLDSTLIVCVLYALGYMEQHVFETFSAVFHDENFSEKKYIDSTISKIGAKAHMIYPCPDDLEKYQDKILYHMEVPYRSLAVLSQHLIYKHIQENSNIKVVLNGQGADEAFGGYTADLYDFIVAEIGQGSLKNAVSKIKFLKHNRGISDVQILGSVLKRISGRMFKKSFFNEQSFNHITSSALPEYLKYDDRNSMAYGIEARAPFMDYRLMEFAFYLTHKEKFNKKLVRDYGKKFIPPKVLNRNDKMGFVSPQEVWQKTALKENISSIFKEIEKQNIPFVNFELERNNLKQSLETTKNWQRVWRIYCYGYWFLRKNSIFKT